MWLVGTVILLRCNWVSFVYFSIPVPNLYFYNGTSAWTDTYKNNNNDDEKNDQLIIGLAISTKHMMYFSFTLDTRGRPRTKKSTYRVTEVAELMKLQEIPNMDKGYRCNWVNRIYKRLNDKTNTINTWQWIRQSIVYLCYSSHLWYFHNN